MTFEKQQLTYQQLNEKANHLAHYLMRLGVKPDNIVAICLDRSLELIIGILGILKAGGAYMPLDSSYPKDRLDFMLADAKVNILLINLNLKEKFKTTDCNKILIDDIEFSGETNTNPKVVNKPNDLAYVIYTFDPTGKGVGVMKSHLNLNYYFSWFNENLKVNEKDIFDFSSSISFDFSIMYNLFPLIIGAQIVICSDFKKENLQSYLQYLEVNKVTTARLTPRYLNLISQKSIVNMNLRYAIVGGETLYVSTVQACLDRYPSLSIINEYGSAETTVFASYLCAPESNSSQYRLIIPIGKPHSNTLCYILDKHLEPVPLGILGELYIGGDGLARGYLNREDLTQERFIDNPFATDEDKRLGKNLRLYRTENLVRYLSDGNIEYLERIDQQVKIRGCKIECSEIENVLRSQESVTDVAVVACEDDTGEKQLVAYLINKQGLPTDKNEKHLIEMLRQSLHEQLSDYMIPSYFVYLEQLPLNVNGKLDHKALPKLGKMYRYEGKGSPETETEKLLAHIWSEVLNLKENDIKLQSNFFQLGGHALLTIKLRSAIEQAFKVEISLTTIFQKSQLWAMALAISKAQQPKRKFLENFSIDNSSSGRASSSSNQRPDRNQERDTPFTSTSFPEEVRRLIKEEGFRFSLKRINKNILQINFMAIGSVLMTTDEVHDVLVKLTGLLSEKLESQNLRNLYKLSSDWKNYRLEISASDYIIINNVVEILKEAGMGYWVNEKSVSQNLFFKLTSTKNTQSTQSESSSQDVINSGAIENVSECRIQ